MAKLLKFKSFHKSIGLEPLTKQIKKKNLLAMVDNFDDQFKDFYRSIKYGYFVSHFFFR